MKGETIKPVFIEKTMNANELADGINSPHNACCYRDKCRQQQAEIQALKSRELTNEEINDIAQQCWVYPQGEQAIFNQHKFAKAILRKASEKC